MLNRKPCRHDLGKLSLVPIISLGLVLTACTSGGSKSTSVSSVTKAQFVAQANALCQASNDQLGKAAQKAFGNQQPAADQWQPFMVDTALPIIEQRLSGLKALAAPSGGTSTVKAILEAGSSAVAAAKANPQTLSPSSPAPFGHYNDLAKAYGIGSCRLGG